VRGCRKRGGRRFTDAAQIKRGRAEGDDRRAARRQNRAPLGIVDAYDKHIISIYIYIYIYIYMQRDLLMGQAIILKILDIDLTGTVEDE
jgi:hypothetical protein